MFRRIVLALGLPMALMAACSLPTDERAAVYDRDDLPEDIANTTTTTTTTTLPSSTSTAPMSTEVSTPGEVTTTTSTLPAPITAPVDVFYTIGLTNDIGRLRVELPEDASVSQVLQQLVRPSSNVADIGLRSAVRNGMVVTDQIVVDRSTAIVPLNAAVIDSMNETVLRRAIAQIVLTLSSFRIPGGGSIGSVLFEVDSEAFPVFVPLFGGVSDPGEPLFFEDFAPLIDTTPGPSTTTSTTATTTTTVPDTTEPFDTTPDDTAA